LDDETLKKLPDEIIKEGRVSLQSFLLKDGKWKERKAVLSNKVLLFFADQEADVSGSGGGDSSSASEKISLKSVEKLEVNGDGGDEFTLFTSTSYSNMVIRASMGERESWMKSIEVATVVLKSYVANAK
jgi:hypothetical protein